MVHVTEENVGMIDVDLLIHEYLRMNEEKPAFVYIVSPFISNYPIYQSWTSFASNIIDVSDVDTYVDLILLLSKSNIPINVLSRSPRDLLKTGLGRPFIENQSKILLRLLNAECYIRVVSNLHAKATITSKGVLSGSFNLTKSGRMLNLEAGFYFPNTNGVEKEEYESKLKWVKRIFQDAHIITMDELLV